MRFLSSFLPWPALALGLSVLSGCGGGGGSTASNTNTATSVLTAGTVTGFGSVVVDGVELEDAQAKVLREAMDGSFSGEILQRGQRVRVSHDGRGVASQITVDAALIGQASNVSAAAGTLQVAGQNVAVNSDLAKGPLTVFGAGYADLGSVLVGDLLEIHGTPVYSTTNAAYTVQATRIAKAKTAAKVQLSGKISGYTTTVGGASFMLNGLTVQTSASTSVRPAGFVLANGLQVTAFSGSVLSGTTLTASHIRVDRNQASGSTAANTQLSGVVSAYDATAKTLVIAGSTVNLGSATVTDLKGSPSSVQNGAYVMVGGTVGSDGAITATSVKVRTNDTTAALAQVLLIGPVADFVDASSFMVRGVPVDAGTLWSGSCPGISPAADVLVKVHAAQQVGTPVVRAVKLECRPVVTTLINIGIEGQASNFNASAKTFTMSLPAKNYTWNLQWNDATTFLGISTPSSPDSLTGKYLHVEGYQDGNAIMAKVIRLDDGSEDAPRVDGAEFRKPREGQPPKSSWDNYRKPR